MWFWQHQTVLILVHPRVFDQREVELVQRFREVQVWALAAAADIVVHVDYRLLHVLVRVIEVHLSEEPLSVADGIVIVRVDEGHCSWPQLHFIRVIDEQLDLSLWIIDLISVFLLSGCLGHTCLLGLLDLILDPSVAWSLREGFSLHQVGLVFFVGLSVLSVESLTLQALGPVLQQKLFGMIGQELENAAFLLVGLDDAEHRRVVEA